MMSSRIASLAAPLVLVLAACAAPTSIAAPDPNAVILENGDVKITVADFEAAMTRFPEDLRLEARANPETIMKIIDSLYVNRMLAKKAAQAKISDDELNKLRAKQLEEGFYAGKYLEKVEKEFKPPALEARAQELYRADPKTYTAPAMVELADVVVSLVGRTPQVAVARANEARAKLVAGAPLAEVARQYSDDPQVARHQGSLGWVRAQDLEEPVSRAAFAMTPGNDWSQPIVTRNGVHVLRVSGKKDAKLQTFDEVKATIVDAETGRLKKKATEDEVTRIRTDKGNKIYPEVVESLRSKIDPGMIEKAHRDAIERIQQQR